jgi:hypothetical protein
MSGAVTDRAERFAVLIFSDKVLENNPYCSQAVPMREIYGGAKREYRSSSDSRYWVTRTRMNVRLIECRLAMLRLAALRQLERLKFDFDGIPLPLFFGESGPFRSCPFKGALNRLTESPVGELLSAYTSARLSNLGADYEGRTFETNDVLGQFLQYEAAQSSHCGVRIRVAERVDQAFLNRRKRKIRDEYSGSSRRR